MRSTVLVMLLLCLCMGLGLSWAGAQTPPGAVGPSGPATSGPATGGPKPGAAAPGAPAGGHPCIEDAQRLCPGVAPGGGALEDCMRQHAGQLSPACKANLERRRTAIRSAREACAQDVQKYCSGLEPGRRNVGACLREHADQLSPACRQVLRYPRGTRG